MILNRIKIVNFRSIEDLKYNFQHDFEILVGLNEAGKSNILKAAGFLNPNEPFDVDDVRDNRHDESAIKESYIEFKFKASKQEIKTVYEKVKSVTLTKNYSTDIISIAGKTYNIEGYCNYKPEVLYDVNLLKKIKTFTYYLMDDKNMVVNKKWRKIKNNTNYTFIENSKTIELNKYKIYNADEYSIPEEHSVPLDCEELQAVVWVFFKEILKEKLPGCVKWTYNEQNLLPSKINFSGFIADPNICVPLRNMFSLSGYTNIAEALTEAQAKTNGIRNILKKVGENTTQHMVRIWPEWKNQKIDLQQNGDFIEAGIEDEYNLYSLSRRSDGFKRFFTFMLMISAQNKTDNITNNLILIDEPDICLHPSGVQYLRNELKNIGMKNKVMISTHSIFMIDKDEPSRHIVVTKSKETTSIKRADISNICDEEVIFKALGYSLYELLKPTNIIFEGWRDKKVFETIAKSVASKQIVAKINMGSVGLLHSVGVKDVHNVANMCENFNRKYIIITDSDKPAKEKQKKFDGQGKWLCYNDIDGIKAITSEDFVSNKFINSAISHAIKSNINEMKITIGADVVVDKVKQIEMQLSKAGVDSDTICKILNDMKSYIVDNLKYSDLDNSYCLVLQRLVQEIHSFQPL